MNHDALVAQVQARAKSRQILSHYCRRGQFCAGDNGMPDLFLAGAHNAAWIEVKTPYDRLEPAQTTWMHALKAAGQQHHVIRPAHLDDGTLDGILDSLAYGQPVLFGAA